MKKYNDLTKIENKKFSVKKYTVYIQIFLNAQLVFKIFN